MYIWQHSLCHLGLFDSYWSEKIIKETSSIAHLLRGAKTRPLRFVVIGAWNTALGYGLYCVVLYLLAKYTPYAYLIAAVLSNIIATIVAYFGHKYLVFHAPGRSAAEFWRFCLVSGVSLLLNVGLLKVFVDLLHVNPYLAQVFATAVCVPVAYFGLRFYSFRTKK